MKKFSFSLEKLLEYRRREEARVHSGLLRHQAELLEQIRVLNQLHQAYCDCQKSVASVQSRSFSSSKLQDFYALLSTLKGYCQAQQKSVQNQKDEIETWQEVLRKAISNRKVVERYQDRLLTEWNQKTQQEEQNFLDEIATIRYNRQKKHR